MTTTLVERAETLPDGLKAPAPDRDGAGRPVKSLIGRKCSAGTSAPEGGHNVPALSQSLLPAVIALAKDPDVNVEKLEALLRMQERLETRQAEAEFNAAFTALSAQMPRIKKNGEILHPVEKGNPDGPKRKISSYARLEDIDAAIRDLLRNCGFAVTFETQQRQGDGGGLIVTATLLHTAGHSLSASIPVPLDTSGAKNNIQGYGSALSYGRRYALCAVLNIVTEGEDDDGVRAGLEYIEEDKIQQIAKLIEETQADRARFLRYMGVKDIPDILVAEFPRAIVQLERKKRQQQSAGQ